MMLSAIVILLTLIIAYLWAARGLFSAFLHMLAVIAAGGIAFALWEPIAYFILNKASSEWIVDSAWGVGLAAPFIISLAAIRVTLDKTVRANLDIDAVVNLVGGGVCGFVSGTLALGIMMLSLSAMRLPTAVMGWKPIGYGNQGSPTRADGEHSLLFPVERITASFYSMLSDSAFRPFNSGDTLSKWRPALADEGVMLRTNYGEGSSRHTIKPMSDAFQLTGRYTVGRGQMSPDEQKKITADTMDTNAQTVTAPDGTVISGNAAIEAFIINFGPKAREKIGNQQVIIGNTQLRLVVESVSDPAAPTMALHPMAVISMGKPAEPPSNAGPNWKAPPPTLGRWRFNTPETFIASVGGGNEAPMAFEFLVPRDHRPIALYVKGVRVELPPQAAGRDYASVADRDKDIKSGKILAGGAAVEVAKLDKKGIATYRINLGSTDQHIRVSDVIPFNIVLQKDDVGGLLLDKIGRDNVITGGDAQFAADRLRNMQGVERTLQVRKFAASDDTAIVLVTVDKKNSEFGFLSPAAQGMDRSAAPVLIDSNKDVYTPVGFVYRDGQGVHVRFEPGSPITSVDQAPSISTSRPDQELVLIYRVTKGVRLEFFAVGNKALAEFKPSLTASGAIR